MARSDERRDGPGGAGSVVAWAVATAWYVLVTGFTWPEAVAGASVSALALELSRRVIRAAPVPIVVPVPALWRLPRIGRIVARETAAVLRTWWRLLRGEQPRSRFVAAPLEAVTPGLDGALTLEASLAPNTAVVATIDDQGVVLLHQLEASGHTRSSFPRWAP